MAGGVLATRMGVGAWQAVAPAAKARGVEWGWPRGGGGAAIMVVVVLDSPNPGAKKILYIVLTVILIQRNSDRNAT